VFPFTSELRQRLEANLASHDLRLSTPAKDVRHAAVAVVVLPDEQGRACFVLTRRLSTLRRHSGQWALPGGRLEPGEAPEQAALRELHEEVGLELDAHAVLGRLDDFLTRSGHLISPFILWAPTPTVLTASPDEVDAVFRVPLQDLDRPGALHLEPLLHFEIVGSTVFAPTAAVLYQFREVGLHARTVRVAHVEQPHFAWR